MQVPANNMFYAALAIGAVPVFLTVKFLFSPSRPPPILGFYSQPNRWYTLKYCLACMLLSVRKLKNCCSKSKKLEALKKMDGPQQMHPGPKATDAVFFVAANRDNFYLVAATARRPEQAISGFWYFRIPGEGLLKAPLLPDTCLKSSDTMKFSTTDGLLIEPVVPLKHWRIAYDGLMKFEGNEEKLVHVTMNFDWKTDLPLFNFDTDIPVKVMARMMARELWTKQFFKMLEDTHQTHHEQMGRLSGTVKVDGVGEYQVRMDSMRDHSYAKHRDWKNMHRYGLHSVYLSDGTKFCVGIISQVDLTSFEMGYLYTPEGKMHGVDWCDLKLHYNGEGGTPPLDYGFSFGAGGQKYMVECKVIESPELFLGDDWECRIIERMCCYRVNGIDGWGFAEWEYRNRMGRDVTVNNTVTGGFFPILPINPF